MKTTFPTFIAFVLSAGLAASLPAEDSTASLPAAFKTHCVKCHGQDGKVKGEVNLLALKSGNDLLARPGLLETLIDVLHQQRPAGSRKPRTYRKKAHRHWLSFSKLRRPSHSKIRAIKRKLLCYLTRNIKHLFQLIDEVGLCSLNKSQYKSLLVIREICRQQHGM